MFTLCFSEYCIKCQVYIIIYNGEESAFVLIKYGIFIDALGIVIGFSGTG